MSAYPTLIAESLKSAPDMPLGAGVSAAWPDAGRMLQDSAAAFDGLEGLAAEEVALCETGMLIRYNQIDVAHEIVGPRTDSSACLWHAIIHRREGDYPNARYWVQQAGNHPVYNYIAQGAGAILAQLEGLNTTQLLGQISNWDATMFVKLCERALSEKGPLEQFCLQVQDLEWEVLFHYCFQQAVGAYSA